MTEFKHCPDVLRNCAHTQVMNERGESIGCAEYAPEEMTAWQRQTRRGAAVEAEIRAYVLRNEADYILYRSNINAESLATAGEMLMDAEMWEELATWLRASLA